MPQVFERVLSFDGENGNTTAIKKTLELAQKKSVSLSMNSLPANVKSIWDDMQTEAQQQKKLAEVERIKNEQKSELRRQAKAQKEAEAAIPIEEKIPWIAKAKEFCQQYRDAPNEIKKSAVFNKSEAFLKKQKLKELKGTIEEISTSQGGGVLHLEINVGDITFTTPAFSAIKKGSTVYKQVTELAEDQCVIFTASNVESFGLTESTMVCNHDDFYVKFRKVKPCTK